MNFGFLSKKDSTETNLWSGFNVGANVALIRSRVDLSQVIGSGDDRPLQGQSPYIVNASINYSHPTKDWSITASYNIVGQRIYIVGNEQEPSVWENGRNLVDFQLVRNFEDKFEMRLNVKDALANELVFFQDLNKNQKFDAGDNAWQNVTFGQTVSLSLKYNF